jgi:hypothetical protein
MNWLKSHPIKAIGFAMVFTFIATFAGCRSDLRMSLLIAFGIVLTIFVGVFMTDTRRKLIIILLAGLMFMTPGTQTTTHAAQRKGGEVVIAVVVVCTATYCIYRLARFCQQHFPPPNTNQVNNVNFGANEAAGPNAAGGTNFGASFALDTSSCSISGTNTVNVTNANPTSFFINSMVLNGELHTSVSASDQSSSMEQFMADTAAEGLQANGNSYSINGEPAPASSVPISYTPTGGISNGVAGTTYTVSVQASSDMHTWQPLFSTTASEGTAFQVVDTVLLPQTFYRLVLQH